MTTTEVISAALGSDNSVILRLEPPEECLICGEGGNIITLSCTHTLCVDCIQSSIAVGRPSNNITYGHLLCPLRCKVSLCAVPGMKEIGISDVISMKTCIYSVLEKYNEETAAEYTESMIQVATLTLVNFLTGQEDNEIDDWKPAKRNKSKRMVAEKMLVENMSAAEIENPLDVLDESLRIFDYFQCFKCQAPFFGGKHACAAALPQDTPKENIICGKCSSVGKVDCKLHGKEYIEWKCMFCCSKNPVTYLCGGVDNYCNRCHQRPGTCYPCNPADCVFDGVHPIEAGEVMKKGARYALGCILCNDQVCKPVISISKQELKERYRLELVAASEKERKDQLALEERERLEIQLEREEIQLEKVTQRLEQLALDRLAKKQRKYAKYTPERLAASEKREESAASKRAQVAPEKRQAVKQAFVKQLADSSVDTQVF